MAKLKDILQDFTPDQQVPKDLGKLYELMDDEDSQFYKDTQALYDDDKTFIPNAGKSGNF